MVSKSAMARENKNAWSSLLKLQVITDIGCMLIDSSRELEKDHCAEDRKHTNCIWESKMAWLRTQAFDLINCNELQGVSRYIPYSAHQAWH